MNSRERVKAMLSRKPVDRVPIFMWFHPRTAVRLARELEIPVEFLDEAVGNDVKQTWIGNNHSMEGVVLAEGESRTDPWGVVWRREGGFNQNVRGPLEEADASAVASYELPAGIDSLVDNLAGLRPYAGRYFLGADVSPCTFELYNRLRGMENALLDLALDPEGSSAFFGKCADFELKLIARAIEKYSPDWIWLGDDVGGQQALLMSPDSWRTLILPHLRRLAEAVAAAGLPVAYHSCGAVHAIVEDLIEAGVNVLNPIQCNCPGMEPEVLHRRFGARLTFMGGVDTQRLLPTGSADEVYGETRELLDTMLSDGGSYILAASHTVPPETPSENIFAMYAAAGLPPEAIRDRAAAIRRRSGAER